MKILKDNINDFFKWVKGTELVELDDIDVSEDPVRPDLTLGWRITNGRKIYGLKYDNAIEGIICIAYTNDIPHSVKELDMMSELAHLKDEKNIAIAYTVWSRKRGAGKEIIHKVLEFAKKSGDFNPLHLDEKYSSRYLFGRRIAHGSLVLSLVLKKNYTFK